MASALAEFDLQAGMMLMTALHGASRHVEEQEMAASLVTEDSRQIYNLACLLSLLKRTDQAIDMVARALRLGCPEIKINWICYVDPDLVNIRQEARFQDLFS